MEELSGKFDIYMSSGRNKKKTVYRRACKKLSLDLIELMKWVPELSDTPLFRVVLFLFLVFD